MDFKKFYNEQKEYIDFRNIPLKQFEYNIISEYKANTLTSVIPKNKSFNNIMEIGCAHGVLLNKISIKLGIKSVVGIDIASKNIELAKSSFPDISFFCCTIEEYITSNPTNKFEIAILSDIIEHIPDEVEFLKKISGIAKTLLINLPLEKCYYYRNRVYGESDPSGHLRNYSFNEAFHLFEKCNLRIINYRKIIDIKESKEYYNYLKKELHSKLKLKTPIKRLKSYLLSKLKHYILIYLPSLYHRLYGYNLFVYVESKNFSG